MVPVLLPTSLLAWQAVVFLLDKSWQSIQSDVYNTVYQETGSAEQASKAASTAATDPLVLLAAGTDVFTGAEATSLITGAQKAARRATAQRLQV